MCLAGVRILGSVGKVDVSVIKPLDGGCVCKFVFSFLDGTVYNEHCLVQYIAGRGALAHVNVSQNLFVRILVRRYAG